MISIRSSTARCRTAFGSAPNPEGTQPVNLVTSDEPPMFLAAGTHDPIVRIQNTQNLAQKLQGVGRLGHREIL